MELKNFGLNLAKKREAYGISAYELSLRLGRDPSYINKIENSKMFPSLPVLFDIASNLETTVDKLFIDE